MRKSILSCLILLALVLFSSCSETPVNPDTSIDQMIDGWRAMVSSIQSYSGNPDELRHKTYILKVKPQGNWTIGITPREAFDIRKESLLENTYKVYITNPFRLFENRGGLTRMTYVQASLIKVGGIKGAIELGANVECIFRVKFFQDNGQQVNFSRLQEAYDYEFISEPENGLKVHSILQDSATFIREAIGDDPISLKIKLTDKMTKENYLSNEVIIPQCSRLQLKSKDEMFIPRSAGQCVQHVKTLGNFLEKNTDPKMQMKEVFSNNCPLPVRCQLKTQYAYVQNKNVTFVENKTYDFVLAPLSTSNVDTGHEFQTQKHAFDSKLYKAGLIAKGSLPTDAPIEEGSDSLTCSWEKTKAAP